MESRPEALKKEMAVMTIQYFQPLLLPTYLPPPQPPPFFSPPSPPPFSLQLPPSLNFNLPTNINEPAIGRATKFGEIEAVKSEQELTRELPKNDIKHEIDELIRNIASSSLFELSDEILNVL